MRIDPCRGCPGAMLGDCDNCAEQEERAREEDYRIGEDDGDGND